MTKIRITAVHQSDAFFTKTARHRDSMVGSVLEFTEQTKPEPTQMRNGRIPEGWMVVEYLLLLECPKRPKLVETQKGCTFHFYAIKYETLEA